MASPEPPPRIRWDAGRTGRAPERRRIVGIALFAGVLALVACLVAVLPRFATAPTPPPVDPYAVDEVAQRYRALGATLLAGVLTCAPHVPQPGQAEAVGCSFGAWTLLLVSHADRAALDAHRATSSTRGPATTRWATTGEPDSVSVLSETATGAATVYWDSTTPRPVSATATAAALPLPDLLAAVDARGVPRALPELPGPAFRSGTLWALAEPHTDGRSCRARPAAEQLASSAEEVRCGLADGVEALFVRDRNAATFEKTRAAFRSGTTAVPGSLRSGEWRPPGGTGPAGLLLSYRYAPDDVPQLYADHPETSSWVLLRGTGTPERLREFWESP
ncbi:hypothetical protein [Pseudonocardia lacus]|uniref:hypothetical protein n=1 Tax=Pseudonocardia lacus TaxID=2835865 RepID=UPI001BDBD317|nr:hypothetical protein [Pseudonocardia lacus]